MWLKKSATACLLGGVFVFASLSANAEVFINEIHYDDSTSAGDVGERIEVVATAGEDLSTYKIYLYNGSTSTTYDNDPLGAGSNVTCGSTVKIAVLSYITNGIQNGAPDGIALVNSSGSVVQFLSYEGGMSATDGPATGTSSINIPVSESNSTAAGTSLQLGGTGSGYATFTWNNSATDTFGACNNNQTFNLGPPVNVLPSVSSTNPANNGNVLPGTNTFSVNFSENVNLTPTALTMSCSLSGTISLSYASSGSNIAISSAAGLQDGDSCALTVHADQITDADAANPATNTVVNFTVSPPPNTAPTVFSTTPSNNAVGVPAATDIRVVFNENVAADSESFVLQCSASGLIPLSFNNKRYEMVTGAGRALTLRTFTALQAGETCTLTVIAPGR